MLAAEATPLPIPPVVTPPDPVYQVVVATDSFDAWSLLINAVIGVATVATLYWTVRTTLREIRNSDQERTDQAADRAEIAAERARQRRDQEREQASHVVAWSEQVSEVEDEVDDDGTLHTYEVGATRTMWLHNTSSAPVYDVRVHYRWEGGGVGLKLAWQHLVLVPLSEPLEKQAAPLRHQSDRLLLSMTFRDSANRWWRRDERGNLTQVRELENGDWVADDGNGGWEPTTKVYRVHQPS